MTALAQTSLPLALLRKGKVRDVYAVGGEHVLIVATDRVSAFDVVMKEVVPFKGVVLTQLTAWWLSRLEHLLHHHLVTADAEQIISDLPSLAPFRSDISGRAMLCRRAEVFPVECVIRGYLAGSAWKEYSAHGTLAGERLPPNLRESERLPVPLFSPATKAEAGHDENITTERMAEIVGDSVCSDLERLTRRVYDFGTASALDRGVIIADTKLEFGFTDGDTSRVILVDEVLTPDSSRFWPSAEFRPGGAQPSFDKQPLRDYLDAERSAGRWNGEHPPPPLPPAVIDATSRRYLEIYERLTLTRLDTDSGH